jgi:hypothetical protein
MLTHILPLFLKASHLSFDGIDDRQKAKLIWKMLGATACDGLCG